MTFVPDGEVRLLRRAVSLTDYQVGDDTVHHRFCGRCGVKTFGRGIADELNAEVDGDFYPSMSPASTEPPTRSSPTLRSPTWTAETTIGSPSPRRRDTFDRTGPHWELKHLRP